MKDLMRKLVAGLSVATLLAACGGGSDDEGGGSSGGNTANRPVAVLKATVDGTEIVGGAPVEAGSRVTLDASGSSTSSGTLSYAWRVSQQPGSAAIVDPQAAKTYFEPKLAGEYVLGLSVDNGEAIATEQLAFTVVSAYPVAAVDRVERDMPLGQVQLDGRASQPPTGGDASKLVYDWSLVSLPPASAVKDLDATEKTQAQPRFTADVSGKYEFELTVSYEGKASLVPATLVVNILPAVNPPKAVVTPVSTGLLVGDKITLSGADSTPGSLSNSGSLQYRWTLRDSGGILPAPDLEGATTAQVSFTPYSVGTLAATLVVFDGVQSASTTYSFGVTKPEGSANTAPIAVIVSSSGTDPIEIEPGARVDLGGRSSYDLDGELYSLQLEWTLLEEPAPGAATLTGSGRYWYLTAREYDGDTPEQYKLQLRVRDSLNTWSEPVTATYKAIRGANRIPSASAAVTTGSSTVSVGTTVVVTGAGSTDQDSNRLSYQWTLVDKPDGSTTTLQNADQVQASFVADKAGSYRLSLTVTDSHGASGTTATASQLVIFAKSTNYSPVVRPYQNYPYDRDQPLLVAPMLSNLGFYTLTGQDHWSYFEFTPNAYDPDGDILSYLWTLTQVPDGYDKHHISSAAQSCLAGASYRAILETLDSFLERQLTARQWTNCTNLAFAPSKTGTYDLALHVSDGVEVAGPFNFSVQAATREDYPTLLLEDLRQAHYYRSATLWAVQSTRITGSGTAEPTQVLFPAVINLHPGTRGYQSIGGKVQSLLGTDFVFDSYRLTAGGGDYTITDLKAVDAAGEETIKFKGLADGQVIRKGESVDFQLAWTINNTPEACVQTPSLDKGRDFKWSFGIKEMPGYTFEYQPKTSSNAAVGCDWAV